MHHHAAFHQLIGPAARASAQIDRVHAAGQAFVPLVGGDEHVERFFQLQRRTARRIGREAQTRNAHVERRVVVAVGVTDVAAARRDEEHVHHRASRVLARHQHLLLAHRAAQRYRQLATELHQLFAFVGVRHFHPQLTAAVNHADQHADDRRYPIFRRQIAQQLTHHDHLAGENQFAERNFPRQAVGIVRLIAFEQHVTAVLFYPCKAVNLQLGGFVGDLRRTLFFKARTAVQRNLIHGARPFSSDAKRQSTSISSRSGSTRRQPA